MQTNSQKLQTHTLYIVATPIGNLADISARALDVLAQVDWIAAEDTRHSQKLLQHFGINKPLISLHEHNEQQKSQMLLEKLQAGETGALISDAGTPLISDPGFVLVKELRANNINVSPIPGASAMIAALSVAGLPTDSFSFYGFLPAKNAKREAFLQELKQLSPTMVFYESPHRILESLESLVAVFGERQAMAGREMTKKFEQFVAGSLVEILEYFQANQDKVLGEFVLVVEGNNSQPDLVAAETAWIPLIEVLLKQNLPVKQISEIVSDYFGVKKNQVYSVVQSIKDFT